LEGLVMIILLLVCEEGKGMETDLVVMRGVSLWIVVGDCLCRRGDELDLMTERVFSLRRVDAMLLGHRRRMILNLEWTFY
jgi:hypothetical protein